VVRGRIAVVGAGLAGLAAAIDLKDAGFTVDVYERSRLLGGRATSFEIDGHEVDNGQHVFLACCTAFVDFVTRVGMADCLHVQPRFDARIIARDGTESRLLAAPLPAPLHLLVSFAGYRHLSLRGRLSVGRALLAAKGEPLASDGTFTRWLERHGQNDETMRAFWNPFFIPALNAPLDRVAVGDALFVVRTAFLGAATDACFGFSTVPLAHIARAAAERVDRTILSNGVMSVERTPESVRLRLVDGATEEYDAAVLALPPSALAHALGDPASYGLNGIEAFEAFPIIDVHLWHDGGTMGYDFAALLDSPVQWVFEKAPGYVCASMSAAGDFVTATTAELAETCWREIVAAIPSLRAATVRSRSVTRNPNATYLPPLGASRPGQRTTASNVAIAGSWTQTGWPDTMEAAVRSGRAAASILCENVKAAGAVSVA
jgi:squalene-associated FAD-dependent desaturase